LVLIEHFHCVIVTKHSMSFKRIKVIREPKDKE
jgi:hypothetical protein